MPGQSFSTGGSSIPKMCQYFRTRSPVTTADIDDWHARDLIAPLFFNDSTELHNLIRKRLILPYLTGSFHPSFIEEYAGGLLMTLQKHDSTVLCYKPMSWLGQIRPSLLLVLVLIYRPWRSYRSRLAVAGSFRLIRWGTTSALVPTTPRRLTTGRLINLLTSSAQSTK